MEVDIRQEGKIVTGNDNVELPAGKTLIIETSPNGEEILNYTATKDAFVSVTIRIVEEI